MSWKKHNLTDETVMWFGKYKGKKLKDVPDSYFQYLLNHDISFRGIKNYAKTKRELKPTRSNKKPLK